MSDIEFQLQQARRIGRLQGALDTISASAESAARHYATIEPLRARLIEIAALCKGAMDADQRIETGTAPQCPHCTVYILDEAAREYHLVCGECGIPFCHRSPQCPRKIFDRHPRD